MELKKMIDALNASQQATALFNAGSTSSDLRNYTNIEKIVEYRRLARDIGRKASTPVLNEVYPEMGTRFKNDFLGFIDTFLQAYDADSDSLLKQALAMDDRWVDWYEANTQAIRAASDKAMGY
jgi:hypothetical protein